MLSVYFCYLTPNVNHMRIVAFLAIIFCSHAAFSQSNLAIELANKQSNRKIIIKEGKRVAYTLKDGKPGKGRVKSIMADSIQVGNNTFAVTSVRTFGKRPAGGRFWGIFLMSAGGIAIMAAIMPDPDPCPDCTDVSEDNGNSGTVLGIGIGAVSAGLGIAIFENTLTRKIDGGTWDIQIVEVK